MSTSDNSCNDDKKIDGASKSNDDNVCEVNNMLQNMSTADEEDIVSCANCGKEGDDINNICNKCKQVRYCNASCKKKHRHKHKAECEEHIRLAAERAAKLHDEKLFKQPPQLEEDCPICFIRLPFIKTGSIYMSCCGKTLCSGCSYAPVYDNQGNQVDNQKCPFCRTPYPRAPEEAVERLKSRMEANDAEAIYNMGCYYRDETNGYPQDYTKALEFYHRAAELGYSESFLDIGYAYEYGEGVEVDTEKTVHYYEQAAMEGNVGARYNLGINEEEDAGNMDRALKHYMIAVRDGYADSLKQIKRLYTSGHATKEDYTKALQSYQSYLVEIKSSQRDKAAASYGHCRYY